LNKSIRTSAIGILAVFMVSVGSVSAIFYGQSPDIRAERIYQIAYNAGEKVGDFIDIVYGNETVLEMIENATLTEDLENNVTRYNEGMVNVTYAYAALEVEDYEGAIANATEALSIFREVYRSINIILCNSDVTIRQQLLYPEEIEEAIERSLDRVKELQSLISTQSELYSKLASAEDLLNQAKDLLLSDDVEAAADNLREANILISQVCQSLKQIAQELNPSRIRSYLDETYRYRVRFRESFGQAGTEGFDVNGFLQQHGYQNEEEFMTWIQQMIEKAQGTENIQDAIQDMEEIGRTIREMDQALTQEMGQYRGRHGQGETGSGFGQQGSGGGYGQSGSNGYGGNGGSGSNVQGGNGGNGYGQSGSGGSGQKGYGSGK
jgi:hypothetical protein